MIEGVGTVKEQGKVRSGAIPKGWLTSLSWRCAGAVTRASKPPSKECFQVIEDRFTDNHFK